MPICILIMHRKAIVQSLMDRFEDSLDITLIYEPDYNKGSDAITTNNAKVAIIEAAESGEYDMDYCLRLCKELRKDIPECKLLLMCSEQEKWIINLVVEAKNQKQIDDFVFYDVSIDYLVSKLITI